MPLLTEPPQPGVAHGCLAWTCLDDMCWHAQMHVPCPGMRVTAVMDGSVGREVGLRRGHHLCRQTGTDHGTPIGLSGVGGHASAPIPGLNELRRRRRMTGAAAAAQGLVVHLQTPGPGADAWQHSLQLPSPASAPTAATSPPGFVGAASLPCPHAASRPVACQAALPHAWACSAAATSSA